MGPEGQPANDATFEYRFNGVLSRKQLRTGVRCAGSSSLRDGCGSDAC